MRHARAAALLVALTVCPRAGADGYEKSIDDLYARIAGDLSAGRPLVATVFVALCDNDSQGIVPVKNAKICDGDRPGSNLYWSTSGGLKAVLESRGWTRVLDEESPDDDLAVRAAWTRRLLPGKGLRARGIEEPFDAYVVGLAYRGARIHQAMSDYMSAVGSDGAAGLDLADGTSLEHGGASHVVGYIGHDHLLDVDDPGPYYEAADGGGILHKGVFALACFGESLIRPGIAQPHTHVLVLNKSLTYPGAWTAHGILMALAAGKDAKGIHHAAAKAFADGKGKPLGAILGAFTYGG